MLQAVACDQQLSETQRLWERSIRFPQQWSANAIAAPTGLVLAVHFNLGN
jgi:hypothetical protein